MMPLYIKKYFWDINTNKLNTKKYSTYIISRILEYGDSKAINWLFRVYNKDIIKEVILKYRGLSPKSSNFWRLLFNLDKSEIVCMKKSYQKMQKTHWSY